MFKEWYFRWIEQKELEGFHRHSPYKISQKLEWGLEYLGLDPNSSSPKELIKHYTEEKTKHSKNYFTPEKLSREKYTIKNNILTFPSNLKSVHKNSDTVYCKIFPKSREKAVIVIPHWNSPGERYDSLCKALNFTGMTAIRFSMPYHDQRLPTGENIATYMVSSNIGLTIYSMQQAVQDLISTINWLEYEGFNSIGIVGASIGSCVGFFAAVHDDRVKAVVNNLMSSYFGEVVWTGISTQHIKKGVENNITMDDLKNLWLLNSPIHFIEKIKKYNPKLKHLIISGKYDTTFLYYLSKQIFKAYEKNKIEYKKLVLPCGHYSLGASIFKYIDGIAILKFLLRNLKS